MSKEEILSKEDLNYYIEQNEVYYRACITHKFHVGEVALISNSLTHDKGCEGKIGIIESWTGTYNYDQVFSYDDNAKRYWACGFNESDLISMECTTIDDISIKELKEEYCKWILANGTAFLPKKENIDKTVDYDEETFHKEYGGGKCIDDFINQDNTKEDIKPNKTYRELFVRLRNEYDELFDSPVTSILNDIPKYFEKLKVAHYYYFINDAEYEAIQKHIRNKNKTLIKTIDMVEQINKNKEEEE